MAYARSAVAPRDFSFTTIKTTAARTRPMRPGFWRRIYEAMAATRLRQAEGDIARYLSDNGGKLTDEIERDIERRFLSNQPRW